MSKNNKVNRDHYVQRGRLTPDEAARELVKQRQAASPKKVEGSKFGEPDQHKVKQRVAAEDETEEEPSAPEEDEAATDDRQTQTKPAR